MIPAAAAMRDATVTMLHKSIPLMTKMIALSYMALTIASRPCLAADLTDGFLEFHDKDSTTVYDLSTIKMILPGRFTIFKTHIDQPDVMKFESTVVDTFREFCKRPDGKYSAPPALFTLRAA
jgi:hypothetical protein